MCVLVCACVFLCVHAQILQQAAEHKLFKSRKSQEVLCSIYLTSLLFSPLPYPVLIVIPSSPPLTHDPSPLLATPIILASAHFVCEMYVGCVCMQRVRERERERKWLVCVCVFVCVCVLWFVL